MLFYGQKLPNNLTHYQSSESPLRMHHIPEGFLFCRRSSSSSTIQLEYELYDRSAIFGARCLGERTLDQRGSQQ